MTATDLNREGLEYHVANAINIARYQTPSGLPAREFHEEDRSGQEYALRLARAAIRAYRAHAKPDTAALVEALTHTDDTKPWPALKMAIWRVVTAERLNSRRYVKAKELTDKLFQAALAALSTVPAKSAEDEPVATDPARFMSDASRERLRPVVEALEQGINIQATGEATNQIVAGMLRSCLDHIYELEADIAAAKTAIALASPPAAAPEPVCPICSGLGVYAAGVPEGWQPIETAPKNRKVLAASQDSYGKWRIIMACYHTQLPWSDEHDVQPDDSEYAPEGWYEESDSHETLYPTSFPPTHWMPLPARPADGGR